MGIRGSDLFNAYNEFEMVGKFQMPRIRAEKIDTKNTTWSPFNFARSYKESRKDRIIHFFIHDHLFERVWNTRSTLHWVVGYRAVLTPDFSTYTDTSIAYQIWQRFRSQYIGAYCQSRLGLKVIPTLCWSTEASFEYTFDGIDKGCVVACNSIGIEKQGVIDLHLAGLKEAIRRIEPAKIFVYGGKKDWYPDYEYEDVEPFHKTIDKRAVDKKKETS